MCIGQLSQAAVESIHYLCHSLNARDYGAASNYHKHLVSTTFVLHSRCHRVGSSFSLACLCTCSNPDETGQFLIGIKSLIQLAQLANV